MLTHAIVSRTVSSNGRNFIPASELPELSRHLPVATPTYDVDEIRTPDRRGLLEMETPVQVILSLAANNSSGLLVCQDKKRRKEAYLKEGYPVYVGSNDSTELLGEFLVAKEIIERKELEMALALLPKFNGHLGDTLIALGMLSALDLFGHISDQVTRRLEDLLSWKTGSYEFFEGVECRPDVLQMEIEPFTLIRKKLLSEVAKIDALRVLDEMSSTMVAPSALLSRIIDRLKLPESLNEKITSVGEWIRIRDVMTASGQSQTILVSAIYVAIETGMWTFEGTKPPWRNAS